MHPATAPAAELEGGEIDAALAGVRVVARGLGRAWLVGAGSACGLRCRSGGAHVVAGVRV